MYYFKVIIISFLCLLTTMIFMGGGHGTYIPAKIMFPFTMIIAQLNKEINSIALIIALVQIPIYGLILKKKPQWNQLIIGVHILGIILSFYLNNKAF